MTTPCDPEKDEGVTDDNLMVKMRCNAFSTKFQELYDFELTFKEFFEGVNVREPLINVIVPKTVILYAKMHSLDDKNRLLQFSNDQKDKCVLYKSPVTVSAVREILDYDGLIRKYHDTKEEVLDLVMPYHRIPYKAQLAKKMEVLETNVTEYYLNVKTQLMDEKKFEKQNYPDIPKLEKLIESPNELGFLSEFVFIVMEYDIKKKRMEAGVRVFSQCKTAYYFLPIRDCIHIAPQIIDVVERFVEYLTLNMDDLKEFKEIDEELNTGFVQHLKCSVGDEGEVQLTVVLAYYSNVEEFAPIADFYHPISFKAMQARYRSQQQGDKNTDEKMEVVPQEEHKTKKSKKPDWSSESENANEYKFVAQNFDDCHPSFRFFDFAQADSQLDVAVPFLRKFYEENKEKLRISGIYVNWYHVCRRPEEWTRRVRAFHHVCGDIRSTRKIDGLPFHKFPFAICFGPSTVNYDNVLKQLVKLVDVKKNADLAIACEYRLVLLFFVQKCRNIMALNEMSAQFPMAKDTKTRIIFTGQNVSKIDFAYRKFGVPPAALIIWGTLKNPPIKRLIAYGVEKIAYVQKMTTYPSSKSLKKYDIYELTKLGKLSYPYLYLKRVIAIDCDPGGGSFYVIALFEKNKEAPPHPAVDLHKLEPELESKLPPTALPAMGPKRAAEDGPDNGPSKRKTLTNRRSERSRGRRTKGGWESSMCIDPEKLDLLKQIKELKAEQEQLKKLLSRGGPERDHIRGANFFFGRSDEIDRSRQTDYRRGRDSFDSCRDVGRGARSVRCEDDGDRYASIRGSSRLTEETGRSTRGSHRYNAEDDRYAGSWDRYDRRDSDRYASIRGSSRLTVEAGRSTRSRDRYNAEDDRYAVSPDRYSESDESQYGGREPSRMTRNNKTVGYRNVERFELDSRGKDLAQGSTAPRAYRSAYGDIKEDKRKQDDHVPPPPPPPVISKR